MNRTAKIIGLDIAKSVFGMGGIDGRGVPVIKRMVSRSDVLATFANIPATAVAIEACAGSQGIDETWARSKADRSPAYSALRLGE
jgi:hypothetical protein